MVCIVVKSSECFFGDSSTRPCTCNRCCILGNLFHPFGSCLSTFPATLSHVPVQNYLLIFARKFSSSAPATPYLCAQTATSSLAKLVVPFHVPALASPIASAPPFTQCLNSAPLLLPMMSSLRLPITFLLLVILPLPQPSSPLPPALLLPLIRFPNPLSETIRTSPVLDMVSFAEDGELASFASSQGVAAERPVLVGLVWRLDGVTAERVMGMLRITHC
jgi:hypothetical protein